MRISKKIIAACQNAGACSEGLAWISAKPRTVKQLYKYNRSWFFWMLNILSPQASDAYNAAMQTARDAYDAAEKQHYRAWIVALDTYNAAVKSALIKALRQTFA